MNHLDRYILKAERFLLFAYVVLLPANFSLVLSKAKLGNLVMILWSAAILLAWMRGLTKPRLHWTFLLFCLVFLLAMLGLVYAPNFSQALRTMELRSGIIVLPFLVCSSPALRVERNLKRLVDLYIVSSLTLSLYCLIGAGLDYYKMGNTEVFLYHSLSGQINMHAVYLSVFLIMAIGFVVHKTLFEDLTYWKKHPFISLCVVLILVGTITLLSSRIAIAFTMLLLMASVSVVVYRKWGTMISLVGTMLVAAVMISIVFSVPSNRDRFKEVISYGDEYGISGKWGDAQFRYLIWTCAWEVTVKGSIWGVGTGDAQRALSDCYVKNDYKTLAYLASEGQKFNAHNQFLQLGVEFGWIGVAMMATFFVVMAGYSFKEGNILMLTFLALTVCFFTTESVLERYNGISFFSFLGPLLFYFIPKKKGNKNEQ